MQVDVIYARALKPGDLWAGIVEPHAPTRPVNNFAHAMRITDAEVVTGDDGRQIVQCHARCGALTPVSIATQVMVIRADAEREAPAVCGCCVDNDCECEGEKLRPYEPVRDGHPGDINDPDRFPVFGDER